MTNELVERVARAIYNISPIHTVIDRFEAVQWRHLQETTRQEYRKLAYAAIRETLLACREPTLEMLDAGTNAGVWYDSLPEIWQAMIDAKLEELEKKP